jgi:hypothetical protein
LKTWWQAVLRFPPTWIAVATVLVAEWLFMTLFDPPLLLMMMALAFGAVAVIAWPGAMLVTGTMTRLQFEVSRRDEVDPEELRTLQEELQELDDPRPIRQFEAVQVKRDNLAHVLARRLDAGELTYAKYMAAAQAVYRSSLDNLHEVAVGMRSISAIDEDYIAGRLSELGSSQTDSAVRERGSLESRLELRHAQEDKIADLLAQNESGMTAIDRTASALADAPIGRTPEDAEAAMAALEELAQRAGKYASG